MQNRIQIPVRMELVSDTIFGSGRSVPGDADIYPQTDEDGFPYMKGSTFKGIFRETLQLYLGWLGHTDGEIKELTDLLLGVNGADKDDPRKLLFSDFVLSETVRGKVLELPAFGSHEKGTISRDEVTQALTNLRTFTSISEEGTARAGSLRSARCIDKGLVFYSTILCDEADKALIEEVLGMIKWVGSMRNRGFGQVKISNEEKQKGAGQ